MQKLFSSLLLFAVTVVADGQNLVKNPGFESVTEMESWETYVLVAAGEIGVSTDRVHSGKQSCEIYTGTHVHDTKLGIFQNIGGIQTNEKYTLSFWIVGPFAHKVWGGVFELAYGIAGLPLGIDSLNNSSVISANTGEFMTNDTMLTNWARVDYYFHTVDETDSIHLLIETACTNNPYWIYFDDFEIAGGIVISDRDQQVLSDRNGVISPNPSDGSIFLTLPDAEHGPYTVEILSLNGSLLKTYSGNIASNGNNKLELMLDDLPSSVYIYRCKTRKSTYQGKLIKL